MSKNRIFYYDALRALAIIGILSCHVAASFALEKSLINTDSYYLIAFFDCFRDFSIPIFVTLSGALLLNRPTSLNSFIKKRFNRVFIPFVFWVIIYILFSVLFLKVNDPTYYLGIILGKHGTIGVIFWFIWMIIIVYILIFIINQIFNLNKKIVPKFIKISVVIFLIYSLLKSFGLIPTIQHEFISYIQFIGYSILGYYLSKKDFTKIYNYNINPKIIIILTLSLSICIYVYYIIFNVVPISIELNKFHSLEYFNILIILLSSSIFLLFRYVLENNKIENKIIGKITTSISIHSFGIYFIHYLILKYIYIITDNEILTKNPIKAIPLLLIVVFISSWFIIYILDKIPYLNKISGTS